MSHVYINQGRIIPEGWADKQLEKMCAQADVKDFQEKHPIIGEIFKPILYYHFQLKYK